MKKVFESKYGTEVEALKKHLEDKCFESQIHETFENFELLVDENIYDEVLTEINGMKKKLSGSVIADKNNVEHSIVTSERCSPHAFSVDVLTVLKALRIRRIKAVKHITAMLPIDQVVGS